MFAKPRAKVSKAPPRKRRKDHAIEEVNFDFAAREDYLTGFHKRKLQRIKHAQDQAAEQERQDRIAHRKALRDERKQQAEQHVQQVNDLLGIQKEDDEDRESPEEWEGIEEAQFVDHVNEYNDEDKYTTVTVEAVDIDKEGIHKMRDEDDESESENETERAADEATGKLRTTDMAKGKRVWTKDHPNGSKKRKKKFRYESKADRKVTRMKERSGNKAKARERRS